MTDSIYTAIWQTKSCLLPPSPLAGILERFIEQLPRHLIQVKLNPTADVAVINQSKGEYKATSNAPRFAMTFAPALPQGGWYYLEAALVRNNGSRETSIRADIRGEKSITIPIPTNLRGTVREVFYLPSNVTALHWLPTAAPGVFSQSSLLVHKITLLESTLRQIYRVLIDLWRFRSRTSATRAGLTWWGAISNLQDAYQRTAALRVKRLTGNDYSIFIALNDSLKKADSILVAVDRNFNHLPLIDGGYYSERLPEPTTACPEDRATIIWQRSYLDYAAGLAETGDPDPSSPLGFKKLLPYWNTYQLVPTAWTQDTSTSSLQQIDLQVFWKTKNREDSVAVSTLAYVRSSQ